MNINLILTELKKYLADTQEYNAIKRARAALDNNPEARALVSTFNKKREALYAMRPDDDRAKRLMAELDQDFASIRKYPVINTYFDALEGFDALLGNFMNELNTSLLGDIAVK